jgi:hypothetical protein
MSIQRPTVQFNLVSGPPDLESFCRICMTGLSRWIFSRISAPSMVASTETPLCVPKAQHCLHIHVGTTNFSLFPITFYCTELRHLVNYRALEVRIPIYNLINQSISLLYFFSLMHDALSNEIQVSKDLHFFSRRIHFFIYMTTSNLLPRC